MSFSVLAVPRCLVLLGSDISTFGGKISSGSWPMVVMCSEDSKEGGMDLDTVQMFQIDPNIEHWNVL